MVADTLGRSLAQIAGVVVSSPTAVFHAAVREGGAGGVTTAAVAAAARRLQADAGILVSVDRKGRDVRLLAAAVIPGGKDADPVARHATLALDTDFFNLQSDFVFAVIAAMDLKPTAEEKARVNLIVRGTASASCFDLYGYARQQILMGSLEAHFAAVDRLKVVVKNDDEYALAHAALAEAATLLSFQNAYTGYRDERLKISLAAKEALRAVALRPEIADTHRALALAYILIGEDRSASAAAKAALAIQPSDAEALLWLGLSHGSDGKEEITRALDLDPALAMGHLSLGVLAKGDGDTKTMVQECEKALELNPQDPSPALLMGRMQTQEGKVDDAIATYERAIRINPRAAFAYAALSRLYFRKDQADKARDSLQSALNLDYRVAEMMRQQAVYYQQGEQWGEAEKEYRLLLLGDEKDTSSWRGLGTLLLARNKVDEAEKAFRRALAISPKDAWAYIGLSKCHQRQGNEEEALQDLRTAAREQPNDGLVLLELGRAYERRNRFREAADAYDGAIAASPSLLDAHYRRARLVERTDAARAPAAWKGYLAAVDAGGGPQTDEEKRRIEEAKRRAGLPQ